jgi:hypothetical protein
MTRLAKGNHSERMQRNRAEVSSGAAAVYPNGSRVSLVKPLFRKYAPSECDSPTSSRPVFEDLTRGAYRSA